MCASQSPQTGLSSKPRKHPKRVKQACDTCRLRKIKCDGKIPCSKCVSDDRNCSFGRSSMAHPAQPVRPVSSPSGPFGYVAESRGISGPPGVSESPMPLGIPRMAVTPGPPGPTIPTPEVVEMNTVDSERSFRSTWGVQDNFRFDEPREEFDTSSLRYIDDAAFGISAWPPGVVWPPAEPQNHQNHQNHQYHPGRETLFHPQDEERIPIPQPVVQQVADYYYDPNGFYDGNVAARGSE